MRPSLPKELEPLAKLLEKDEPRVLVVVGTGVSAGATSVPYASWLGLLKHGVQHLVETEVFTAKRGSQLNASLNSAFSPFNLKSALQHAELIEQNLMTPNADAFARWLEAAFNETQFRAERTATLNSLRDLQQAGALLMTTNYDSLLSQATGLPPVTWEEHGAFLRDHEPSAIGSPPHSWALETSKFRGTRENLIRSHRPRCRFPDSFQEPMAGMVMGLCGVRKWARRPKPGHVVGVG